VDRLARRGSASPRPRGGGGGGGRLGGVGHEQVVARPDGAPDAVLVDLLHHLEALDLRPAVVDVRLLQRCGDAVHERVHCHHGS